MQVLPLITQTQLDIKATNMSWNYRVIKTKDGEDDFYQIHEVYYSENGKINGYTSKGATVGGNSIKEIKWVLEQMLEAINKEII